MSIHNSIVILMAAAFFSNASHGSSFEEIDGPWDFAIQPNKRSHAPVSDELDEDEGIDEEEELNEAPPKKPRISISDIEDSLEDSESYGPPSFRDHPLLSIGVEDTDRLDPLIMQEIYENYKVIELIRCASRYDKKSCFGIIGKDISEMIVEKVARKDLKVNGRSIFLRYPSKISDTGIPENDIFLSKILYYVPYLSVIDDSFNEVSASFFKKLMKVQGKRIKSIEYDCEFMIEEEFDEEFTRRGSFDNECFMAIAEHCKNLEVLKIISAGYGGASHKIPSDLIANTCATLKYLYVDLDYVEINDRMLQSLFMIESVECWFSDNLFDSVELASPRDVSTSKLKNLRLQIKEENLLPTKLLKRFLERAPNIEKLLIEHIEYEDDEFIQDLHSLKKLKKLVIVTPNLKNMIDNLTSYMPNLEYLVLQKPLYGGMGPEQQLTQASLSVLFNNCPKLKKLAVYNWEEEWEWLRRHWHINWALPIRAEKLSELEDFCRKEMPELNFLNVDQQYINIELER